jgi:hypothetical protein
MYTEMHRIADPEADPAQLKDPADAARIVFDRIIAEVRR